MPSMSGVALPMLRSRIASGETALTRVSIVSVLQRHRARALHRLDDLHVAGAAAEVAAQRRADLGLARRRVAAQERFGAHDQPRRAESALRAEPLVEGALQPAHPAPFGQRLDRLDAVALDAGGERDAGKPRLAVDQHRAGAALPAVAALLGAGQ